MDFTFGICAIKENEKFHADIVESIKRLNIPNFEIIFIGESCPSGNVNFIYFEESQKPGWITKKKNQITKFAKYDNIVYSHDYIEFQEDWYNGFKEMRENFDVCMNKVLNFDGTRNIDWLLYYQDLAFPDGQQLLPYHEEYTKLMFIPGFYWVAKKQFMSENPLNENLIWGEAEDIEWSKRVRQKTIFKMNDCSTVKFLKQKEYSLKEISEENMVKLRELYAHFK